MGLNSDAKKATPREALVYFQSRSFCSDTISYRLQVAVSIRRRSTLEE